MDQNQLLSSWINEIIHRYFKSENANHTEKLFIKISGFDENSFQSILNIMRENISSYEQFYQPIIRTITPVQGFKEFECREQETSTWLRNNTHANEALVLVINEVTPEGQSLENIFTIDESYLLSDKGMDALFEVLTKSEKVFLTEIDTLKTFLIKMFYKIVDPQLKVLLGFLNSVLDSNETTIVTKIQQSLPELGMFRDSRLEFKQSGIKRLKQNYYLSNLQSATSDLDVTKLQEKLYSYMQKQEQLGYPDELWHEVQPDDFIDKANAFLNYQLKEFYELEFEVVEKVFNFKTTTNLKTQLEDIYEQFNGKISEDKKEEFLKGIEEVQKASNPEKIQEFIEEFEEILDENKPVYKKLNRLVDKLRNPSEYNELYEALTSSLIHMLSEYEEELTDVSFRLEVMNDRIHGNVAKILRFYLQNINQVIQRISFDSSTIHESPEADLEDPIQFALYMNVNGKKISQAKFKINQLHRLNLLAVLLEIEKNGLVPYIMNIDEEEEKIINIESKVRNDIDAYLYNNQYNIQSHFDGLTDFLNNYNKLIQHAIRTGLFSINSVELIALLERFLEVSQDSYVATANVYKAINLMGVIDYFDNKQIFKQPIERIVTVIHPIRLINYIQRYKKLHENLEKWIEEKAEKISSIEKAEEYIAHLVHQTKKLAPAYFVLDDSGYYLLEENEIFGEGRFLINTSISNDTTHLSEEVSSQVVRVVKNYIEVYPYARDGFDLMLMYCDSVEVVSKVIDAIFKETKVRKLNIAVHSQNAAKLHHDLNKWIEQKEEYSRPESGKKIPKLELSVISGKSIRDIQLQVSKRMSDADMVMLVDYFAQNEQVKYEFQNKKIILSDNWFFTFNKAPLNINENIKHISFTSDNMPSLLWQFYKIQHTIYAKSIVPNDEAHLLENKITINQHYHSDLLEFMHDRFNWVMILDRYLDRTLLQKATQKAQIIQYKSKTGKKGSLKLIVSSSRYVRKLVQHMEDADYYDRLRRKLMSILKTREINKDQIMQSIEAVKEISGALVLKVLGKGKFSHEMLATYLTTRYRTSEKNVLSIWALCDELPWFASNQRRPDIVLTTITEQEGKLKVKFELIELKFVNHHIFDRERIDAIKQLKTGLSLYDRLFNFENKHLDAAYWRDELVDYIIERGAYPTEHVELIKRLQRESLDNIAVEIDGYIDVYCYTDNLTQYNFKTVDEGIFIDTLEDRIKNYIFNRSFILQKLGVNELVVPNFDELEENHISEEKNLDYYITHLEQTGDEPKVEDKPEDELKIEVKSEDEPLASYPENIAFKGIEIPKESFKDSHDELVQDLMRMLKIGFNQNGIHIVSEKAIVGSSVIRIMFKLPKDVSQSKVTNKSKDMQLWLELNNEPNVFINKEGINVDIIRENPDTIYFNEFMQSVRGQLQDKIKDNNLIAPLGLDPLNQVLYLDFASPDSPHLLTGGTSGSGKSVTLNSIILGMMCLYDSRQLQFVFIDPKQVEFSIYENCQHTANVVTDINEAVQTLNTLVDEMEKRYARFKEEMVTNLEEYNEVVNEKLPRIVIVFDEFADFMSQEKEIAKQVEINILRLGQKARAAGIHLIICTQNPKADIINTNIRNNLGARLALRAADATASTIILDEIGAEKLAGKGDFLAKVYGRIERGKSPFLTAHLRRSLLNYFKKDN
ncbi:FtsK/SpoIIIE domain-containing protein [Ectobacillus antri]|uniref:FtsK/SpoIIIE domain-containing protein n=1 Tax=Ectobacillus antri TaxID=2486280 RepID=UPI000F5A348B|nr:FtsK/SpoIIIE domain-containing protein [Ectobacillus antri]